MQSKCSCCKDGQPKAAFACAVHSYLLDLVQACQTNCNGTVRGAFTFRVADRPARPVCHGLCQLSSLLPGHCRSRGRCIKRLYAQHYDDNDVCVSASCIVMQYITACVHPGEAGRGLTANAQGLRAQEQSSSHAVCWGAVCTCQALCRTMYR